MKKHILLMILCLCFFKTIQAQTFDYSDLDKGYVEWEGINSFCFEILGSTQQVYNNGSTALTTGGHPWDYCTYAPSQYQLCDRSSITFYPSRLSNNRFYPLAQWAGINGRADCSGYEQWEDYYYPVYGGWIPAQNTTSYINKSILKKVYYGDDAVTTINLKDLSFENHQDVEYYNGAFKVFAPFRANGNNMTFYYTTSFHRARHLRTDGNDFHQNGVPSSDIYAVNTRPYVAKYGANHQIFNAKEWANADWAKDVESYTDALGSVRNLNGGVEVYVVYGHQVKMPGLGARCSGGPQNGVLGSVVYQYDEGEFKWGGEAGFFGLLNTWLGFFQYANLAKIHVYSHRPKWKENAVKATYCSSEIIDLRELIDLGAGKFSGKFVIEKGRTDVLIDDATLDLSSVTTDTKIGVRCYPYYTADNNENISMYMEITVVASEPLVDNGEQFVCSSSDKLILERYSPQGGIYTGSYIKNNELDVAAAAKADLTAIAVTYKYTSSNGCQITKNYTQTITSSTEITFDKIAAICEDKDIDLEKYITLSGGTFSGHGITGSVFSPNAAGIGYHPITYMYIDEAHGCETIITQEVQVRELNPTVEFRQLLITLCQNEQFIDLNDYIEFDATPTDGTFSGTGVQSGHYFYPDKAKEGFNVIKYSYGSSVCKQTISTEIRIKEVESLSFSSPGNICTIAPVDLSNLPNIKDGTFTGIGVQNNIFTPSDAGLGVAELTYNATTDNDCPVSAKLPVLVSDLLPRDVDVKFETIPQFCANDANYYDLSSYIKGHEGGSFSGRGIENNRFYPNKAIAGFNIITYTYGTGVCRRNLQTEVYVNSLPQVQFSGLGNICDNGAIDLTKHVTPSGGTFSGPGVNGTSFYPALVGLGQYTVSYDAFVGQCPVHGEKILNVVGLTDNDASILPIDDVCHTDENYIDLRAYVINAPTDGVFSGNGVDGTRLYPNRAKTGFNTIRYNFNVGNCSKTITTEVYVKSVPTVYVRSIPTVCDKKIIDLNNYTDTKGGIFSGIGISGNTFIPEAAGIGQHTVKYTVDFNGCVGEATMTINVSDLREEDIAFKTFPSYCKSDSIYVDLRTYVRNHEGGTFAGTGIESYRFYPSRAREGFNTVTYTFGDGSCKKTITAEILINVMPTVNIQALPKICQSGTVINLNRYVTPGGGIFSGPGVVGTDFYPDVAGTGKHNINHTYTDQNGCVVRTPLQVEVIDLYSQNTAWKGNELPQLCNTDEAINLSDYINDLVETGIFSGTGVENGRFYPDRAKEGFNTISYTYGEGNCKKTIKAEFYVQMAQPVLLNSIPYVCTKSNVNLQNLVNIKGGNFFYGGNLIDNFYPENYGIGKHQLHYEVPYRQCTSKVDLTIEISDLMEADIAFDTIPSMCKNDDGYYELAPYVRNHEGGTFAGTGVENGRFYPSRAREGFNVVSYTYGEGNCKKTIKSEIYINIPPVIIFNNIPYVCSKDVVNLSNFVNLKGGVFSYASNNISELFYPETYGIGKHELSYEVSQDQCVSKATFTIEIGDLMEADIAFDSLPVLCKQDMGYIDLRSYIQNHDGGTFAGTGVENGRFYPGRAKEGFNIISYTYGEGNCKKTIKNEIEVVNYTGTPVSFLPIPKRCDATPVNLIDYVNIKTGTFSGAGVVGTDFYPDVAGIGKHDISYVVKDSIFNIYANTTIEVVSLLSPNVRFKTLPAFCRSQGEAIDLMEYIENSEDGTFSGKGVKNNRYFYPNEVTTEDNVITYTYGTDICKRSISTTAKIYSAPNGGVIEIDDIIVCCGARMDLGKMVTPAGGTFTGEYTTPNGIYSGDIATSGEVHITYVVANKGCILSREIIIRNENTELLDFTVDVETVGDGGKVHFIPPSTEESSYHWTFGDGAYSFEPSPWHYYYHPGTHTVSLEMKDRKGCIRSVSKDDFVSVTKANRLKTMSVGGTIYILSSEDDDKYEDPGEGEIKIYPNPTTGYCYVVGAELLSRIVIYNVMGNIIYDNAANSLITIPGPSGIYFIKCFFKDKRQPIVIKTVKQ
ncbi:MAG: PKD domain-containing protein [Bacteroidales bacterium]|jgi:hypothetical protein|nr:PKD domain-containing protein [Bacteroidales bacterium]